MNRVVEAVLFCAFFTTSLIHGIKADAAASPAFASNIHQLTKRAATPQVTCGCTNSSIPPNVNVSLTVFTSDAGLYSPVNLIQNVSFILDVNETLLALINGNNGAAVVVNITSNTGVYLANGTWTATNQSYEDYLNSLTDGLAPLLEEAGAVSFKVSSASSTILKAVNQVVTQLVSYIEVEIQLNPKYGLQLIINLSKQLIEIFTSSFGGDVQALGGGVTLTVDLAAEVIILETLGEIFSLIPGGLETLQTPENLEQYPPQLIASQTSGLGRFIIIFNLIANVNNTDEIIEALNSTVNNVEPLFNTLNGLGGNINTGLAGLIKVISNLIGFLNGGTSLEVFIQILIQFLAFNSPAERQAIPAILNQNLTTLLEAIEAANATEGLSGLVDIANDLLNKTLEVDGVNISAVISLLTGDRNVLEILVAVLLQLTSVVGSSTSLPTCLLVLILNLNNPFGVELLRGLGIIINLGPGSISLGNIIGSLVGSLLNIVQILLGNLLGVLKSIPVIGNIVLALEGALGLVAGGQLNLNVLITANISIQGLLKALLQVFAGVPLGIGSSLLAEVQGLLDSLTNATLCFGIE